MASNGVQLVLVEWAINNNSVVGNHILAVFDTRTRRIAVLIISGCDTVSIVGVAKDGLACLTIFDTTVSSGADNAAIDGDVVAYYGIPVRG